jgi:hypothetical protein
MLLDQTLIIFLPKMKVLVFTAVAVFTTGVAFVQATDEVSAREGTVTGRWTAIV